MWNKATDIHINSFSTKGVRAGLLFTGCFLWGNSLTCFSVNPKKTHVGFYITFLIAGDQILLRHAWWQTVREGNERSTLDARSVWDLKPFRVSQVTYYIHFVQVTAIFFFKGIVGTLLINPFPPPTHHTISWHANEHDAIFFLPFSQNSFSHSADKATTSAKVNQTNTQRKDKTNWLHDLERGQIIIPFKVGGETKDSTSSSKKKKKNDK